MNPISKRRLPPSLRSLLTDIRPREEWTDADPDPELRDGILLPPRAAAADPGDLLAPVRDQSSERRPACGICHCGPSLYTCPRCNAPYCSVSCYKSQEHSACSEDFYKESVLQELKEMGKTEAEGRKKIQEMLIGLKKSAEKTEGGMESLLLEEGVLSEQGDRNINAETVELLSRLAELQETGEEGDAGEIESILTQLETIGGETETEEADVAEKLQGLDIDKLSEEELWSLLSEQQKEKFIGLVQSGGAAAFVPVWKPWWEQHEDEGSVLVEELQGSTETTSNQQIRSDVKKERAVLPGVPPVSAKIPKLSSLCPNPSPLVGFSLVHTLYGYSFALLLFNGDTDSLRSDFCDLILELCEALSSNRVFGSVQEAVDSAESLVLSRGLVEAGDTRASVRAVEAVAHILTGRGRDVGFCLSALSQIRSVLSQTRAALAKDGEEGKRRHKCFLANKKCEFLQAWAAENGPQVRALSSELWTESRKRERERSLMNEAKAAVERGRRSGKQKAATLIEEI